MGGGRKQMRDNNGRFIRNTLTNCFGISERKINTKAETSACKHCGHECKPILKTWNCPKCKGQNNVESESS